MEYTSSTYSDEGFEPASPTTTVSPSSALVVPESTVTTCTDLRFSSTEKCGDEPHESSAGSTCTMATEMSDEEYMEKAEGTRKNAGGNCAWPRRRGSSCTNPAPSGETATTAEALLSPQEYGSEDFEAIDDTASVPASPSSPPVVKDRGEEDDTRPLLLAQSPATVIACVQEVRAPTTAKQEYLTRRRKVAEVRAKADILAQRRHVEELRVRLQAQENKESWHFRIHRRHTDQEWHILVAMKTSASIVANCLHRDAWITGSSRAEAKIRAMDDAFTATFAAMQAGALALQSAAEVEATQRATVLSTLCASVWDACRQGVPLCRLRELMEPKMERCRHTNRSEPFEQLCRRVEGVVVESRHPYTKGIRQELEVCVPGAESFYVVFDAGSNTTAGAGKVSLLRPEERDPVTFSASGAYGSSSTRLPGVNGEPPLRVEGSSVLITFSASYWRGAAPAGEDFGWRCVCFTATRASTDITAAAALGADARGVVVSKDDSAETNNGDNSDSKNGHINENNNNDKNNEANDGGSRIVAEAERAADRAEAVDAISVLGETCLHVACFEGNVSAARYLLSLDADPNSAHTASGLNTPLHEAVRGGSLAATRLLLKSSANILATNAHGDLPLHVACRAGRLDIARRLLAHDSDWSTVGAVNHAGLRPSDVARRCTALSSLLKVVQKSATAAAAAAAAAAALSASAKESSSARPQQTNIQKDLKSPVGSRRSSSRQGNWTTLTGPRRGVGRVTGGGGGAYRSYAFPGHVHGGRQVFPRWARLPRQVEGGDGTKVGGVARSGSVDDAQSFGSSFGSGTSYAASLTGSDFQVPCGVGGGTQKERRQKV